MLPDARGKDTFGSREIPTASALSNVRQSFSFQLRDCPGECWRPGDTSIVQYAARQQPVIRSGESPERVSSDAARPGQKTGPVSYTHLRAHETVLDLVCRLLLEKKKKKTQKKK